MAPEHDRRENDEVTRELVNILKYFDSHKEDIVSGLTSGVKLRELLGAGVLFGSILVGMFIYLLEDHAAHPHHNAVHRVEFNRAMDKTNEYLVRLEEKIDRLILDKRSRQ